MYKLIFKEDFKDKKLNLDVWNIATGGNGFGNRELQHYTDREENLFIKDGILNIVARRESYLGNEYTSAKITTANKLTFKYGKIKVRAKLPKGGGTWPAIWTLGSNFKDVGWPICGEIDIMEYIGNRPNEILFSIHSGGYNHKTNNNPTKIVPFPNINDDFRVFELEWFEDKFIHKIDGQTLAIFEKGSKKVPFDWPFQEPHFLILNLAIGGTLGGKVDESIFPAEFLIDYIEIYERADQDE